MFTKVLAFSAIVACSQAGYATLYPVGGGTSYTKVISAPIYAAPVVGYPGYEGHHGGGYEGGYGGGYGAGYGGGYGAKHEADHYAYPKYKYSYGVHDPHTGDHKSQSEVRDGDVVKGYYTVAEPDGTHRIVHYTADDHNGFNAVVERAGHAIHPVAVPLKVVVSAPVYGKTLVAAPVYGGYGHGHGYY